MKRSNPCGTRWEREGAVLALVGYQTTMEGGRGADETFVGKVDKETQ